MDKLEESADDFGYPEATVIEYNDYIGNTAMDRIVSTDLEWYYQIERWMYGIAFVVGIPAFIHTIVKLCRTDRRDLVLATRLFSYKISLTVADSLVLLLYAPTQFLWITTFWWWGGEPFCKAFKFFSTFGFHLTANMQVLVALDRLMITARMSHLNSRRPLDVKKTKSNTRLALAGAWIFSLLCAAPQLFIFRVATNSEGYPQCISYWTEQRDVFIRALDDVDHYDHIHSLIRDNSSYVFYSNGTLKVPLPSLPNMTRADIEVYDTKLWWIEQSYNVIHLSFICILPYMTVLCSYALIIYILNSARDGNFMNLTEVFKSIFCCCLYKKNAGTEKTKLCIPKGMKVVRNGKEVDVNIPTNSEYDLLQANNGISPSYVDEEIISTDMLDTPAKTSTTPMLHDTLEGEIINDTDQNSTDSYEKDERKVESKEQIDENQTTEDETAEVQNHSKVAAYVSAGFTPVQQSGWRIFGRRISFHIIFYSILHYFKKLQVSCGNCLIPSVVKRRDKQEELELKISANRESRERAARLRSRNIQVDVESTPVQSTKLSPWLKTVLVAKRNARNKAFYMLTMNIIFWGPYCMLGVVNAVMIFEAFAIFQFVSALVVFNAISNIIL